MNPPAPVTTISGVVISMNLDVRSVGRPSIRPTGTLALLALVAPESVAIRGARCIDRSCSRGVPPCPQVCARFHIGRQSRGSDVWPGPTQRLKHPKAPADQTCLGLCSRCL
jgi:hypothetical protein